MKLWIDGQPLQTASRLRGIGRYVQEFIRAISEGGFGFDYRAKYLAKATQEICPGRFARDIMSQLMDQALRAHKALSCSGYSRSDFIVAGNGLVYLETNTLPGLTKASLYPKALGAHGIAFADFLQDQIALAEKRAQN